MSGCNLPVVDILALHDKRHLDAAQGWLGLGLWKEANEELEQITSQSHPDVLGVRWDVYAAAGERWKACLDIGEALVKLIPDRAEAWIRRSFALHELKRTQEALDLLLPAPEKFPENCTIPYNLCCYCSQLLRFEESKEWFKKAMAIDEQEVKRMAIDDPDLKPLWDSMSGST
jgi:tetratricopeptide (TPR) repeat protein